MVSRLFQFYEKSCNISKKAADYFEGVTDLSAYLAEQ